MLLLLLRAPKEDCVARGRRAEGARALELALHALLLHVAQELAGVGEAAGEEPGDGGVVRGDEVGRRRRGVLPESRGEEARERMLLARGERGTA